VATDDQQVLVAGTASSPASYLVPGNGQIRPKTIFASYDGTSAAGAFLPALKIVSDAGETVGIFPTDASVAAGASADVSWFPRLAAAASAATDTGVQWFFARRSTNQSIPSANLNRISWTHHVTSDPTVFSVTTTNATDDTVNGLKAGVYIAAGQLNWDAPQNYPHYAQISTDFFGISPLVQSPVSDSATASTEATRARLVGDFQICLTQAVPGEISFSAGNADAIAHNVTLALYAIAYFPNSTLVT
jgi:hypothetical protein